MRKLQTKDIFQALRLIKKANLKEEIKPVLSLAAAGEMSVQDVGIEGILSIIEIFSEKKAESAIYEFLSGPFEMEPEEVEALELMELMEKLNALGEENNLSVFFTSLSGMMQTKS